VESYGADTAMTITRFTHAWTILRNARSTTFLWPFALLPATTLVEDQNVLKSLGTNEQGQDIAEYGVMLGNAGVNFDACHGHASLGWK
jgi:hypothetical protein